MNLASLNIHNTLLHPKTKFGRVKKLWNAYLARVSVTKNFFRLKISPLYFNLSFATNLSPSLKFAVFFFFLIFARCVYKLKSKHLLKMRNIWAHSLFQNLSSFLTCFKPPYYPDRGRRPSFFFSQFNECG